MRWDAGLSGRGGEEFEEFDGFAVGEGVEEALGHEALGEFFAGFDVFGWDGEGFGEGAEGEGVGGIFFDDASGNGAVEAGDDGELEGVADDGVGVGDVFEEVGEAVGVGASEVGADFGV